MTIEIWGKEACPACKAARQFCRSRGLKFEYKIMNKDFTRDELLEEFPEARSVPQIRIHGKYIGGYDDLRKYVDDTGYNGTGYSL